MNETTPTCHYCKSTVVHWRYDADFSNNWWWFCQKCFANPKYVTNAGARNKTVPWNNQQYTTKQLHEIF